MFLQPYMPTSFSP